MSMQFTERRYEGTRLANEQCVVGVFDLSPEAPKPHYPLTCDPEVYDDVGLGLDMGPDEVNRFEFGQSTIPTLRLAVALLADCIGSEEPEDRQRIATLAMPFAQEVLSCQAWNSFVIDSQEIRTWIEHSQL